MTAIQWGIIGCGNVTEKKSGQAYNKIADSKLVAVMRRDAEKAADYAQRHHVDKWYSDAEDLMNDPQVNSVSIATPAGFAFGICPSGNKKGFNIYVEKPVTRNAQEAQANGRCGKESGAKLTVAHYRRGLPMFLHVKSLIDSGHW
jgi:predicted dehydrogenase